MIRLKDVHFSYRYPEAVLKGADLQIVEGLTLLVGPNGCGKSTLLKIIAGVERPDSGVVEVEGHDMWSEEVAARRNLAYVSEQPDLTPYATIKDVMQLVCRLRAEPLERAREVLENVGLEQVANRSIRELSMGQRRRAVLAAAWIGAPRIILLDEPLELMDRGIRGEVLAWIERSLAKGALVVIAAHELEPFVAKAARAVTVCRGRLRLFEPLPAAERSRFELLDSLARGGNASVG